MQPCIERSIASTYCTAHIRRAKLRIWDNAALLLSLTANGCELLVLDPTFTLTSQTFEASVLLDLTRFRERRFILFQSLPTGAR
jgi:hypothetical protein